MSELSSDDEESISQPGLFTSEEILRQMGFNESLINKIESKSGNISGTALLIKYFKNENYSNLTNQF